MTIPALAKLIAWVPEPTVMTIDEERRGGAVAFLLEDSSTILSRDLSHRGASGNSYSLLNALISLWRCRNWSWFLQMSGLQVFPVGVPLAWLRGTPWATILPKSISCLMLW